MEMQVQERMDVAKPLSGRVAVVTGSTSGIGLGIARALAQAGADVVVNGLGDRDEIDFVCAELQHGCSTRVAYNAANLMRPEAARALIEETIADFGKVDILVNNAGIQHVSPIESFPPEKYDAIIALNLSAAFHTIRAAFGSMKEAGFGRIVNVASAHGLVASPFKSAYVAAKHGIVGLTKVVGMECADTGVTCNAICPGWVLTPLVQAQIEARAKEQGIPVEQSRRNLLAEKQPQLQFTTTEQIAGLALFLASDTASNMQGAQLVSDGGWTAQ